MKRKLHNRCGKRESANGAEDSLKTESLKTAAQLREIELMHYEIAKLKSDLQHSDNERRKLERDVLAQSLEMSRRKDGVGA